jgi:hypothetical protein
VSLTLQPVRVGTDYDEDGCLVFAGDRLVAVLVRLSEHHGEIEGQWYFEAGFGRLDGPEHPIFPDLDAAQDYISRRGATVAQG